jgi:hypothetical protein
MIRRATFLAMLALAACKQDDDKRPDDTTPVEDEPTVLPTLVIDSPPRAAFLGQRDVVLQGKVTAGSAELESLVVSETAISWGPTGMVNQGWTPQPGLNLMGARLEDIDGERAVDGRAFVWGPVHPVGERLPGALRVLLGPDLSELSNLFELVLSDSSLADDYIGMTIPTDYADITTTDIAWTGADVALRPTGGGLEADFTLYDVFMAFTADIYGWFEVDGSAWMDSLQLDTTIQLSISGGQVRATASQVDATIHGFGMEVEWVPSFVEDWLDDWVADYLAETLEEEIAAMLEELLPEYLDGLAMDFSFGETNPIHFAADLSGLECTAQGIRLEMDVATWSDPAIELPAGAGSIDTDEEPPAWSEANGGSFALLIDDDLVNQLLFAFWTSGQLSQLQIGNLELAVLMGEQMDPPLGPVETVTIDFQLPPVMQPPAQPDQDFNLGIGELRLAFLREDGVNHDFSVNASTGTTASLEPGEAGGQQVVMALDGRPAYVQLEVGVVDFDPVLDPGDLAALVRLIVPPLLSRSADFMPAVDVPALEMSSLTDMESLQGVTLRFSDAEASVTDEGWLVMKGEFSAN